MVVALKVAPESVDIRLVRRLLPLLVLPACLAFSAPAVAGKPPKLPPLAAWDPLSQKAVVQAGLLPVLDDGQFHGERPLELTDLRTARDGLATRLGVAPVKFDGTGHISVAAFDAFLVRQLGLADVANAVQAEAGRVGLAPPAIFGNEVVARALGLRFNHPFPAGEALELYPWDAITRAEAAYSLNQILRFRGYELADVRNTFATFQLPDYTDAQRAALRIAVSKIGMPYIWGGETDTASSYYGGQVHGGYDCSGFAWRVFKLSGLSEGRRIHGRTADAQAHEIPAKDRLTLDELEPGDLLFFGTHGKHPYASHMGIALGNMWMIHSSSQGVYVVSLASETWRQKAFLWGRRII